MKKLSGSYVQKDVWIIGFGRGSGVGNGSLAPIFAHTTDTEDRKPHFLFWVRYTQRAWRVDLSLEHSGCKYDHEITALIGLDIISQIEKLLNGKFPNGFAPK